jgi:hypothetical protein
MSLLDLIGTYPTVIFTTLLALSLVYWLFVIIGAIDIDVLGGAAGAKQGALDGLAGAGKGALEGAVGAGKGAFEGVAAAKGAAADGVLEGSEEAAAGILSFLRLRRAPVTVVFSLFALFGWLGSTLAVQALGPPGIALGTGLLLGTSIVSLILTSFAIRPIAPFFSTKSGKKGTSLVGKIAVVSTGEVTKSFGQASYEEDGHALTIQVRSDGSTQIKRGDRVVLVDWDESRHAFEIEKLPSHDDVLLHRDAKAEAEALAEAEAAAEAEAQPQAKAEESVEK